MSDNDNTQKKAKIIATAKLTENQVQTALVRFLSNDKELQSALGENETVSWVNWHVNKWDSPDAFCTVSFASVLSDAEVTEPKDER